MKYVNLEENLCIILCISTLTLIDKMMKNDIIQTFDFFTNMIQHCNRILQTNKQI